MQKIKIYKQDFISGGRYAKIFAYIRAILMHNYENKQIEMDTYVDIDDALKEMEELLVMVAQEAHA